MAHLTGLTTLYKMNKALIGPGQRFRWNLQQIIAQFTIKSFRKMLIWLFQMASNDLVHLKNNVSFVHSNNYILLKVNEYTVKHFNHQCKETKKWGMTLFDLGFQLFLLQTSVTSPSNLSFDSRSLSTRYQTQENSLLSLILPHKSVVKGSTAMKNTVC